MTELEFRNLDLTDRSEVEIAARSYLQAPLVWNPSYVVNEDKVQSTIELFLSNKASHKLLVAADKFKIEGFHWLSLEEKHGVSMGIIHFLWVSEDSRGQGIAKELKKLGEEWARAHGAKSMFTEVSLKNDRMISINEALGFSKRSVNMYKDLS